MKLLIALTATVGMLFIGAHAGAETSLVWDAKELTRGCTLIIKTFSGESVPEDDSNLAFYTNGYLSGFVHAHDISGGFRSDAGDFCLPTNVYVIHLARTIVKYTQSHPEALTRKPNDIIFAALAGAYPCRKK